LVAATLDGGALTGATFAATFVTVFVAFFAGVATFDSVFLDVTETFLAGAFGATAGLATALPFAALLPGAAAPLTGFFGACLAAVPAFETALTVALFATFFATGVFDLAAVALVDLVATGFFVAGLAAGFTGFAGFFPLAADERAGADLAGLAFVAEFLMVFLVVAMDRSTIGS
jgi:hypothetical protein